MSQACYPVIDHGLFMDTYIMHLCVRALLQKDLTLADNFGLDEKTAIAVRDEALTAIRTEIDIDVCMLSALLREHFNLDTIAYGAFEGSVATMSLIQDTHPDIPIFECDLSEDTRFIFLPFAHEANYLEAVYTCVDEMIDELKNQMSFIQNLDNIQFESLICELAGTIFS